MRCQHSVASCQELAACRHSWAAVGESLSWWQVALAGTKNAQGSKWQELRGNWLLFFHRLHVSSGLNEDS